MKVYLSGAKSFGRGVAELVRERYDLVGMSAPQGDRLETYASLYDIPFTPAERLRAAAVPECDLIVAAHSHAFIGRKTRERSRFGAFGYHPSLLPRHRGRSAVDWTVLMGDKVAGGSVYWLTDAVDGGPIAAQDYCFVRPDDTASSLWRRELFPLGLELLGRALADVSRGVLVKVPQDPELATWEPARDTPPLFRPELPELGDGRAEAMVTRTDHAALRNGYTATVWEPPPEDLTPEDDEYWLGASEVGPVAR